MSAAADALLFRLAGPMAAFGRPAIGEHRPVWDAPTKSGVLGLVAAALGLRRSEAAARGALHASFAFAVRIDRPGREARDLHTAQAPPGGPYPSRREELLVPGLNTVLSDRRYRTDVGYTVLLWNRPPAAVAPALVAEALRRPGFVLYLGRKSCPLAAPPRPRLLPMTDLRAAFTAYDGLEPAVPAGAAATGDAPIWAEADPGLPWFGQLAAARNRRDGAPGEGALRQFADRREGRLAPLQSMTPSS